MNAGEKNLYQFYDSFGHAFLPEDKGKIKCKIISEKNGAWPQMVYNVHFTGDPGAALVNLFAHLEKEKLPNYIILNSKYINNSQLSDLSRHNIFPVATWEIMENVLNESFHDQTNVHDIRIITSSVELSDFIKLVNAELLRNNHVKKNLFIPFLQRSDFIFWGLYKENKIVSSLLSFTMKKEAGFYFIATQDSWRGKGLAGSLILHAMDYFKKNGVEKVVLQSVQKAVPLYARLGFQAKGKLIIFSKI